MRPDIVIRTSILLDRDGIRQGDWWVAVARNSQGRQIVADTGQGTAVPEPWRNAPTFHLRALFPRPINAHTHLDLTHYPLIEGEFGDFLRAMITQRHVSPNARGLPAVAEGLRLLSSERTGAIGDIVARDSVMTELLRRGPLPGVAYWEVLCFHDSAAKQVIADTVRRIDGWRKLQREGGPKLGLSAHSPYMVSRSVLHWLGRYCQEEDIPLQIHVAESDGEAELMRTGLGRLVESLKNCGLRLPPTADSLDIQPRSGLSPIRYLAETGLLGARPALIHAIHIDDEDAQIVSESRCTVVTCPSSNLHLRCGVFPWRRFHDAGVAIALGTDSLASAHTLSPRLELERALASYGDGLDFCTALEWLTIGGMRVLRLEPPAIERGCALDLLQGFKSETVAARN